VLAESLGILVTLVLKARHFWKLQNVGGQFSGEKKRRNFEKISTQKTIKNFKFVAKIYAEFTETESRNLKIYRQNLH